MIDYTEFKKVVQETDVERVQDYLDTGLWVILSIAVGQAPDLSAYQLFALGARSPDAGEPPLRGKGVVYS